MAHMTKCLAALCTGGALVVASCGNSTAPRAGPAHMMHIWDSIRMLPLRDSQAEDIGPNAGRRDKNRLRTRGQLNSAAIYLFAERGYDNTSVEDVAEAAGISVRTLFRYFTSKEDIVFARTFDLRGFLAGVLSEPAGMPTMTVIRNAYLRQLPFNDAERELILKFFKAMSTTAALQGRYLWLQNEFRQQLANTLAKRGHRRKANEIDILTANVAETVLHRALDRWLANPGRANVRTLVESAFNSFDELAGESMITLH
jgi:AcrR family transcriptional regulator